jgi:hypothetical protein
MQWQRLMDLNSFFLWTLSLKKRGYDALLLATKVATISWWIQKTKVSPNRRKVKWNHVVANVFYEKPTQFLTETQMNGFI